MTIAKLNHSQLKGHAVSDFVYYLYHVMMNILLYKQESLSMIYDILALIPSQNLLNQKVFGCFTLIHNVSFQKDWQFMVPKAV